jgi:co-chaperonin GroES (HSP10)|tara:strand:+ start:4169 stop:4432 length:264 start_codon:yes stop_codon:yes gene_type:complete
MKAIGNYILIQTLAEKTKEVNGLLLTEKTDVDNRYVRGKIISKGENVQVLKENDIIYYDKNKGNGVDWNEKIHYVIRDMDVVLVECE